MKRSLVSLFLCLLMSLSVHAKLIEVTQHIPTIVLDLRYATDNNFTSKVIYTRARCYLEEQAVHALKKVQEELAQQGLGLKVWDAYRPLSAQHKLWEIVPDERYVSNPAKGGRHTRGTALDVTLVRLSDRQELEMPSDFDDFSEKAWRDYKLVSEQARANSELLESVMTKHGFKGYSKEWWHYDYKTWKEFEPHDVDFEELDAQ